MPEFDASAFAHKIMAARRLGAGAIKTPDDLPRSASEAYAVQDIVRMHLGPAAAWKVGAPNRETEPTCAPILASGLDTIDARCHVKGGQLGIELEIAFRLGRDFAPSATAPTADEVRAAIEGAYLAMETCRPRLEAGLTAPPLASLADSGINHGLVLGACVTQWDTIDWAQLKGRIAFDGRTVAETVGGHSHGDIFALLVWQVGHCVTQRGGLARGTVITTGSWTGIVWAPVPTRVTGTFDGVGSMEVALSELDRHGGHAGRPRETGAA
jgi:2-keto-4-pentenoate hydratase